VTVEVRGRQRMDFKTVATAQGVYFFLTGLWALVHIRSFVAVTGPKTDIWLVKTVGAVIVAIGAALLVGAGEPQSRAVVVLACGSASALAAVDVYYASRRVISRIYLWDALAEAIFISAWAYVLKAA
jgi:hypothetical protein